ncbi:PINIT domain containing protein [Pyrenophora tritici-repentis]|uniref:PINIT domain containing protein n=1 Tax=Pyrenophora tritici-repentis TaxID=45151 RepID=A0A922NRQ0_9PLEO|nr:PINIT domain containing protein [Pyrenophora tritici-repentis]KAI1674640.1 PINIT domain containing protein [Pyrenophora tritici-repentis]KAI1688233.1 PINIT domain containing protein [Pyrenophora tritici-repentis]
MASSLQQMAADISERSKTLINNDLKKILKEEGSSQTGNKAALQARVIGLISNALAKSDAEQLRRLQYRVQHRGEAPPPATSSPVAPPYTQPAPPIPNGYGMANGYQANGAARPYLPYGRDQPSVPPPPMTFFKDSPFFVIRDLVLGGMTLEASPSHRNHLTKSLNLNEGVCRRLKDESSMRLLLFSAIEQPLAPYTRLDISFPSQIEVKVNEEEVKANYKGLKNKPGSTRPVDITDFVRTKIANQRNTVHITYALTQKARPEKYNLFIYLVQKYSIDELTQRIKQRNVITRQSVLSEMLKKANDPDIEVGSSVMSLKDPISTLRIVTPCRSTVCTHNQCFDADSFLQLQEQAPTWTCPICNKTISYEALAVDQYVEEILNKARNTDQVTIKPSGEWSTEKEVKPRQNHHHHDDDDDDSEDDLVEIPDYRIQAIKSEAAPTPTSITTPPLPSREASTAPRSGQKRTAEVVDLTLSDDDEPPRPTKKVAYTTPNSIPDTSRRYQLPPLGTHPATNSRPLPPAYHNGSASVRSDYPRPPSTPPARNGYMSYRPAQPASRAAYPGQGSASYPTYIDSPP